MCSSTSQRALTHREVVSELVGCVGVEALPLLLHHVGRDPVRVLRYLGEDDEASARGGLYPGDVAPAHEPLPALAALLSLPTSH